MYDILGRGYGDYPTDDLGKYKEFLAEKNLSDLQEHAARVGIRPISERHILVDRLLKNFAKVMSTYRAAQKTDYPQFGNVSDEGAKKVKEILNRHGI